MSLPKRIKVENVLSSRYGEGERPISWDDRFAGVEEVQTQDGEALVLFSNGGQSSPAKGWEILLTEEVEITSDKASKKAYSWTLYGLAPKNTSLSI